MSLTNQDHKCHAFSDDALARFDAVEIARLIRDKQVSQQEVVSAAIARAQKVNPTLNAIEVDCFAQALERSKQMTPSGFFAGVPTFIKDTIEVKGLPTNFGSAAFKAKPEKRNSVFTEQYLAQGFSLLGKSTLPEFGFNATTEPPHRPATCNPWHTEYSCGASSGGSSALVAAGVVPIAHANDGGGSIRIPSACCGLVGLKPSRNRHRVDSKYKMLPINIVSEGVVTRSVRDTAYFYAEAEKYYRNPKLKPIGLVSGPSNRRLKIGLIIDSITGTATDAETRATVENTARILESMHHSVDLIEIPIEKRFIDDFCLYWAFLAFIMQSTGKFALDWSFKADHVDGLTAGLSKHFKQNYYKFPSVVRHLKKTIGDYNQFFAEYDVTLCPVLSHTPPKLGYLSPNVPFEVLLKRLIDYVSFTPLANVTGAPAISLPAGKSQSGLPLAVMLSSQSGDEKTLLELAYALEEANPWGLVCG